MSTRRLAYTAVIEEDGVRLGLAEEGEPGYLPQRLPTTVPYGKYLDAGTMDDTGLVKSYDEARKIAAELNERLFKITPLDAWTIVASSMRNGVR
jgi:hypothetical protein